MQGMSCGLHRGAPRDAMSLLTKSLWGSTAIGSVWASGMIGLPGWVTAKWPMLRVVLWNGRLPPGPLGCSHARRAASFASACLHLNSSCSCSVPAQRATDHPQLRDHSSHLHTHSPTCCGATRPARRGVGGSMLREQVVRVAKHGRVEIALRSCPPNRYLARCASQNCGLRSD